MTRITSAGGDLQPLAPPDIVSPDRYALNAISDDPTMDSWTLRAYREVTS
jgi:hypothetical protein